MAIGFLLGYIITPQIVLALMQDASFSQRLLVSHFFSYSVWVVVLLLLAWRYGPDTWRHLGLRIDRKPWEYLLDGFFCGGSIMLGAWVLSFLALYFHWPQTHPYESFPRHQLQVLAALAILITPIMEEVIFRGLLQTALYRYTTPGKAVWFTAILFTSFHGLYYAIWTALLYVLLMGLILGLFRYISRSTIPCIIGHLLNNIMAALLILP